jgi:hypothetical protein
VCGVNDRGEGVLSVTMVAAGWDSSAQARRVTHESSSRPRKYLIPLKPQEKS